MMINILITAVLRIRFWIITSFVQIADANPVCKINRREWKDVPWPVKSANRLDNTKLVYRMVDWMVMRTEKGKRSELMHKNDEYYGKAIAIIRFSGTKGVWGAFWTLGKANELLPEYDFEHCGEWEHKVGVASHWGYDYKDGLKSTKYNSVRGGSKFTPSVRFYKYEIDWTPFRVIWRIGGIAVKYERRGISTSLRNTILTCNNGTYCNELTNENVEGMTVAHYDYKSALYEKKSKK